MAGKPKRILFILHEASLSGAPFVLVELIKWMQTHEQVEATVLLKEDGPIRKRFEEICKVYPFDFPPGQYKNRLLSIIYRRIIWPWQKKKHRKHLLSALQRGGFDLIYANTISVGEILDFLSPLRCKVITHVHELQYVIDCMGVENINQVIKASFFYIVVCEDIKSLLTQKFKIDATKILVIPELVNFAKIDAEKSVLDARELLKIPDGSFIVGGAGSMEWRKGVDLFVAVAIRVLTQVPSAHFVWVGNPREANIMAKLNYDIKKAGFEENIKFVGPFSNPYPYYNIFNLFLLTSREDPYPLVCIENMYLKKPVLCFERSGGAVSLVSSYRFGKIIPYLDITQMAEAVVNYMQNKEDAFPIIDVQKVMEEHSAETIVPKVFRSISDILST